MIPSSIRSQFGHPRGWLGALVGHLMAFKNQERSEWVLSLLDVEPAHHVLEIGFGSGADIERLSRIVTTGIIHGIDHSETMLRQASRRNAEAIRERRVQLRAGKADPLPYPDAAFDRVFSINVAQFLEDRPHAFAECRRVLKPGWLVIAVQPRSKGATEQTVIETGQSLLEAAQSAGLSGIRLERKPMRPVSTVSVTAIKSQESWRTVLA